MCQTLLSSLFGRERQGSLHLRIEAHRLRTHLRQKYEKQFFLCFKIFHFSIFKSKFSEAINELTICRMTEFSASVAGGKEMLLFCDKVIKDDIQVRFIQEVEGKIVWEGFGDFQPSDVHKQYGIAFRTPRYKDIEVK